MLDKINTLFSDSIDNPMVDDRKPLQSDELQTLIRMAAECGYDLKNAVNMAAPYGVISSELYAAWYSIEHSIPIFVDNIQNLINVTEWNRSSPHEFDKHLDQRAGALRAMSGG